MLTFFTRQQKYVTHQINKDTNLYYVISICIYLYMIINLLEAEWDRTCLVEEWAFAETILKHFFMFQTFIKKIKTFTSKFFTVTNLVLPAISGPAFLQTSHYIINGVIGIINEPRKLWLSDIVEFALSTFRTRNFITCLAWYFRGYCI